MDSFLKGHGDSRKTHLYQDRIQRTPQNVGCLLDPGMLWPDVPSSQRGFARGWADIQFSRVQRLPSTTWSLLLTLQKWLVITRNSGVMDPFLQGHGDSKHPFRVGMLEKISGFGFAGKKTASFRLAMFQKDHEGTWSIPGVAHGLSP